MWHGLHELEIVRGAPNSPQERQPRHKSLHFESQSFFLSIPFATLLDKRGANGRLHLHRDAGSEAHLCVAHRDAPPPAKRIQPPAGTES